MLADRYSAELVSWSMVRVGSAAGGANGSGPMTFAPACGHFVG
jgi:hypothetical protein